MTDSGKTVTLDLDQLADALATVDGYCTSCQEGLADELAKRFPDVDWKSTISAAYERYYDRD